VSNDGNIWTDVDAVAGNSYNITTIMLMWPPDMSDCILQTHKPIQTPWQPGYVNLQYTATAASIRMPIT